MYELNKLEITSTAGGTQNTTAAFELTSGQLQYLVVLATQSTLTAVVGTPAGAAAKAGLIGLNIVATAGAQLLGNYFFTEASH